MHQLAHRRFVECINSLTGVSGKNIRTTEHFIKCVSQLKTIAARNPAAMENGAHKNFLQFLQEAEKAADMLLGFLDKAALASLSDDAVVPLSAGGEIAAEATYLHWLAVRTSEEFSLMCREEAPGVRDSSSPS